MSACQVCSSLVMEVATESKNAAYGNAQRKVGMSEGATNRHSPAARKFNATLTAQLL
jgi:hypothetical protein